MIEDKWQERWDRMEVQGRAWDGDIGEPPVRKCKECEGSGRVVVDGCLCPALVRDEDCYRECSRCLGTGVQP